MEVVAGQHLTVQTELNLLVGVDIDGLGLAVYEVTAGLGVIQMFSGGIYGQEAQESEQRGGLAIADLDQAVIVLGAG